MAQQISLVATTNTVTRSGTCEITGQRYSVSIPLAQYAAWVKGQHIQQAMPQLTKEQREFFLSSTTPAEWADLFHRCEECGTKGAMGLCRACEETLKAQADYYGKAQA